MTTTLERAAGRSGTPVGRRLELFHTFSSAVRDEYGQQTDRSLDDLGYFEVLTTVRWLLNVLPSTESDAPARADFHAFLVEPVRPAQTFLPEHAGVKVNIRM